MSQTATTTLYNGPIIDCDVHHRWRTPDELGAYLPAHWRQHLIERGVRSDPAALHIPFPYGTNKRLDSFPDEGGMPGTSMRMLREQLLDRYGISAAVLGFDVGQEVANPNPRFAAALAEAANRWSEQEWLSQDDRVYSAILIASQWPRAAAAEIRRAGASERMVEILIPDNGLGFALGHPVYDPIYEAAVEMDLPIAIHFGTDIWSGHASISGGGLPLNRLDYYTLLSHAGMHHFVSMITNGTFERFPRLRVLLLECGLNWIPWVLWQLDANVAAIREECPEVTALPSDYFRRNVWVSTQPLEAGERRAQLADIIDSVDGFEERICFASDYPHWDTDEVTYVANQYPKSGQARMFHTNALAAFGDRIRGARTLARA